jgi:hypothetical protein
VIVTVDSNIHHPTVQCFEFGWRLLNFIRESNQRERSLSEEFDELYKIGIQLVHIKVYDNLLMFFWCRNKEAFRELLYRIDSGSLGDAVQKYLNDKMVLTQPFSVKPKVSEEEIKRCEAFMQTLSGKFVTDSYAYTRIYVMV